MDDLILRGPMDNGEIPKECIGTILLQFFNQQNPENIAFVSFYTITTKIFFIACMQIEQSSGRTISYGEALQQSLKLANSLQRFGITSNDVIAIISDNNIDYYLPVFAGLMIGAPINPLNPTYTPSKSTPI